VSGTTDNADLPRSCLGGLSAFARSVAGPPSHSLWDLDFDFERNVDTTRANVGFRTQLMAALTGHEYFATDPWLFEQIMQALPIRFEDFIFIDLGSGKGRSLMLASDYPFRRIVGVEYLPELHRSAELNLGRYSGENQKCRRIECVCQDARDFDFPTRRPCCICSIRFPSRCLRWCWRS